MANRESSKYYDFTEKLSFMWSSLILLVFVLVIGVLRYIFLPSLMSCWLPSQFTNGHGYYTANTCWEKDLGYLPKLDAIIHFEDFTRKGQVLLHRWIPLVFLLMIIGFKIPEGIKLILDLFVGSPAVGSVDVSGSRQQQVQALAEVGRDSRFKNGIVRTLVFFFVKLLVVVNLLIQFIFVRKFFRDSVKVAVINNTTYVTPIIMFPKKFLCDFSIRQLQDVHQYVVQCDMPVNNLYQEFVRVFAFWILVVGICTGVAFLVHLLSLLVPPFVRIRFRGIIPEKELNVRGFSFDDVLLYLEDVKSMYGVGMARDVATKIWEQPNSVTNTVVMQGAPGVMQGTPGAMQGAPGGMQYSGAYSGMPMTNLNTSGAQADTSYTPLMSGKPQM